MSIHANATNFLGRTVGRLTVEGVARKRAGRGLVWVCKCSCGRKCERRAQYLARQRAASLPASCGCARFTASKVVACPVCNKQFTAKWRNRDRRLTQACSIACSFRLRDISGERNPNWRNNSTLVNLSGRFTASYKKWRLAVLDRDGYQCVVCGSKDELHADHILPWKSHEFLRYEISNGRALCAPCHRKTRTWGNRSMRWAAKRDTAEREIINALEKAGAMVWQTDIPCDLLVRYLSRAYGHYLWLPMEVKTLYGKKAPKARIDKRQKGQNKFLKDSGIPVVTSPEQALRLIGAL